MPAILNDIKENPDAAGIILSKNLRLEPSQCRPNVSIFAFGKNPNRTITANLLNDQGSFIVSDCEGRYYQRCTAQLTAMGYDIKCFDARAASDGENYSTENRYNPIKYMSCEKDAEKLCGIMFKASENRATYGDEITGFKNAKKKLLASIIAYIYLTDKKFGTLCDMLRLTLPELESKFSALGKETYAYKNFMEFKNGSGEMARDLVASLSVRFHAFAFSDIKEATAIDDINLANAGDRKTAIFVIYKNEDEGISKALASMLFTQALTLNYKKTTDIIIENINELFVTGLPKAVGNCGEKTNFFVFITVDDINALWSTYGKKNSMKILKNMGAVIYMGGKIDKEVKKWLGLFLWVKFPKIRGNNCAIIYDNEIYKDKCLKCV